MAKQGIEEALKSNLEALAYLDGWLGLKKSGAARGQKSACEVLARDYGVETSQPALSRWLAKHRKKAWAAARKGAEKHRLKRQRKVIPTFERNLREVRAIQRRRNFVVTCAQNNTFPEPGFLKALQRYCRKRDAELLVVPMRYKNPTSRLDSQEGRADYWWHEDLLPYMVGSEIRPHPLLRVMGQVKIAATSGNPLSARRDGRSKAASAIYGHPQMAMRTVPTPQERLPKILYSTGSVTRKNYSSTDAGDMGQFHHSHGAVVVEIRGNRFHLREVNWDGKRFYDLDRWYEAGADSRSPGVLALYMGDVHTRFLDHGVMGATFGWEGNIAQVLRPKAIVVGDVFDGYSVSHHECGKKLTEAIRAEQGMACVYGELAEAAAWLKEVSKVAPVTVTPSNHDDVLMRWLQAGDKAVEPVNREVYAHLTHRMLKEARETDGEVPNPFELFCREKVGKRVRFLQVDESWQAAGVELGMHGHLGPNGARGSARNLSRIGTRSVIGHSHSPCIHQGVYQVGTSSRLRLLYTAGPSSWFHTHAVVHPNGRRQMIHIVDGHWRG